MISDVAPAAHTEACRRIVGELTLGLFAIPREIRAEQGVEGIALPVEPHTPAWRPLILNLLRALCAVPQEIRQAWIDELFRRMDAREFLSPDDLLVVLLLTHLPEMERLVEPQRVRHRFLQPN